MNGTTTDNGPLRQGYVVFSKASLRKSCVFFLLTSRQEVRTFQPSTYEQCATGFCQRCIYKDLQQLRLQATSS